MQSIMTKFGFTELNEEASQAAQKIVAANVDAIWPTRSTPEVLELIGNLASRSEERDEIRGLERLPHWARLILALAWGDVDEYYRRRSSLDEAITNLNGHWPRWSSPIDPAQLNLNERLAWHAAGVTFDEPTFRWEEASEYLATSLTRGEHWGETRLSVGTLSGDRVAAKAHVFRPEPRAWLLAGALEQFTNADDFLPVLEELAVALHGMTTEQFREFCELEAPTPELVNAVKRIIRRSNLGTLRLAYVFACDVWTKTVAQRLVELPNDDASNFEYTEASRRDFTLEELMFGLQVAEASTSSNQAMAGFFIRKAAAAIPFQDESATEWEELLNVAGRYRSVVAIEAAVRAYNGMKSWQPEWLADALIQFSELDEASQNEAYDMAQKNGTYFSELLTRGFVSGEFIGKEPSSSEVLKPLISTAVAGAANSTLRVVRSAKASVETRALLDDLQRWCTLLPAADVAALVRDHGFPRFGEVSVDAFLLGLLEPAAEVLEGAPVAMSLFDSSLELRNGVFAAPAHRTLTQWASDLVDLVQRESA